MKRSNLKYIIATALVLCVIAVGSLGVVVELFTTPPTGFTTNLDQSNLLELLRQNISAAEQLFSNNIGLRERYIDIYGAMQAVAGENITQDDAFTVVRLENDYLIFETESYSDERLSAYAENLSAFEQHLSGQGIPMVYFQAPYKLDYQNPGLPYGIEDTANDNANRLIGFLQQQSVTYTDLRQSIKQSGLDHYSLFFSTDSHWTPEAALWASEQIAEQLNQYGMEIDLSKLSIDNYNAQTYENWFLGSQGKRMGVLYAPPDDFTLLTPKFESELTLTIPSKEMTRTGDFEQTMLFYEHLETRDYYNLDPYTVYLGGDYPISYSTCQTAANDTKLLVIKDSFARPVVSFMAQCVSELYTIDLRYLDTITAVEYIEQVKPDAVIILYNPGVIQNGESFQFGTDAENSVFQ